MSPTPTYYIAPLTGGSCFYLYKLIPVLNLVKDHSNVRPHLQKYLSKVITVWNLDNRFKVISVDLLFHSDFDIKEKVYSVRITEEEFDYLSTRFEDAGDSEEFYKIIEDYGKKLLLF